MTSYAGHSVQDHSDFICNELLPNLVAYANSRLAPAEVVVMTTFLNLAAILQHKGLSRETLINAIDAARTQTRELSGDLH
ncbi:hypothetical protein [Pseudomonas sp. MWU16-30317]|uniref:hypothetical protein n=1 Tax=Pseudomonas sp. MWU16-30317 TaxID=2878095 RepID=UPI001CFADC89|nr:hypothetical protein [Pseudomonas sp. MWU16-30317]